MSDRYVNITEKNFDEMVLSSTQPVVIDFWADWCGPCHALAPVIEELAADYEGRAVVGKVHVEEEAELAAQFQIRSIPTVLFLKDGEVVDHVAGVVTKRELAEKLDALLVAPVA